MTVAGQNESTTRSIAGSPKLQTLRAYLEEARTRLLDTGRRNRLVHVDRNNKRAKVVHVVDADRNDVFHFLVREEKKIAFRPIGDEDEPLTPAESPTRKLEGPRSDSHFQTTLTSEALEKRLLSLYRDARTIEEEQGVNILYLAIGFLRWFEDDKSEILREAPLILVPVTLLREKARSSFRLAIREEDIETNLSLKERLRQDFGIVLPDIPEDEQWKPSDYFDSVRMAISSQTRWSVDGNGALLGFFSFSKLLMFRDLEPENWVSDELLQHPIVRGLLIDGFPAEQPLFSEEGSIDEILDPKDLIHVVDADSSQALVIETVGRGRNLVVHGPPGTGKSQTITNIIASAVHGGKSVLFIAEKMEALNVVHGRLEKCGLGPICLQLHSRKANKKAVIAEIRNTLEIETGRSKSKGAIDELRKVRDQLNSTTALLHGRLEPSGATPFEALGSQVLLRQQGNRAPDTAIPGLADWTQDHFRSAEDALRHYVQISRTAGQPGRHPWSGVVSAQLAPTDRERLAKKYRDLSATLGKTREGITGIVQWLVLPEVRIGDIAGILNGIRDLSKRPSASVESWQSLARFERWEDLEEVLADGKKWVELGDWCAAQYTDQAWQADRLSIRDRLARGENSFFGRLGRRYRQASKELGGLLKGRLPKSTRDRLALIDSLIEACDTFFALEAQSEIGKSAFGPDWKGSQSDFTRLGILAEWARKFFVSHPQISRAAIMQPQSTLLAAAEVVTSLDRTWKDVVNILKSVLEIVQIDLPRAFDVEDFREIRLSRFAERAQEWVANFDRLDEWLRLSAAAQLVGEAGAGPVLDDLEKGKLSIEDAVDEFRYARAEAVWKTALSVYPALGQIDGEARARAVAQFCELEALRQKQAVLEALAKHAANLPQNSTPGMSTIRQELARRQRGFMPIRKLIEKAGRALQGIKPVFLMSPISVAQFLSPGALEFDLLIIDEASQIRPEDAIGAIARAKQLVVVGDRQQLPPTTFFDRLIDGVDEGDEEGATTGSALPVGEFESILTLCEARGLPNKMLRWHYRSRHPSLIQVSDREFYKGLFIPPSPLRDDKARGLVINRVVGAYDRGGSKTNRIEAEAVVEAIVRHARACSELSLGVATFSINQRDLIEDLLEQRRRTDGALEEFMHEDRQERTFVKNLENVQGDERDVIFISVAYGPRIAGEGLDSMNFGPVSAQGGERRLNVLFTRARYTCEVFCSFESGDLDLRRTSERGPAILKRFLHFAETGVLDLPTTGSGDHESPFEEAVADVIREAGYEVNAQVGAAEFRIDLAVVDPTHAGRYLIGIECDGATYHRARWARDRDRLREMVLRQMGWEIYRIWSTDWFYRPDVERRKLLTAIKTMVGDIEGSKSAPPS